MHKRFYNATPGKRSRDEKKYLEITCLKLVFLTAIFLVVFDNFAFFRNVAAVYPVSLSNIGFLISISVVLTSAIIMFFYIVCFRYTTKPVLITVLLLSSLVSYFMNNYNIVIDETMIQNIIETDTGEVFDLLNLKLFIYLSLAGILPSIIVCKLKIRYKSFVRELISRLAVIVTVFLVILSAAFPVSNFYASFLREHKPLRYYTNPTYFLYSLGEYIAKRVYNREMAMVKIGTDARIPESDTDRELTIFIVGEAARTDRFSIAGYERETNPLLAKEDIIFFSDMHACGTSTAVSIPCMFSILPREEYSDRKAKSTYNVLDVLNTAGVNILWRENNSDSKGVAARVTYQDYKIPENNTICDIECRDEGMLIGLKDYIDSKKTGDILIVLHQMGNHGPAYYKRYPAAFEKFTPVCKSNELEECTREEISNAYDNAILYTDYFLSKVIALLKQYPKFETTMFYVSDHGESLGENNLYLHGLPYFMAPDTQTQIPAIMWFGEGFEIERDSLKSIANTPLSQDNIFHTLLGLMEIETSVYDKDMDILYLARELNMENER